MYNVNCIAAVCVICAKVSTSLSISHTHSSSYTHLYALKQIHIHMYSHRLTLNKHHPSFSLDLVMTWQGSAVNGKFSSKTPESTPLKMAIPGADSLDR